MLAGVYPGRNALAEATAPASVLDPYPSLILSHPNVRVYYRMNEQSGLVLTDDGPNGHDGNIPASGITYAVPGALINDTNDALGFDGTNTVTVPDNALLDLADGPFSLEFWVQRTPTQSVNQVLFNKGTNAYELRFVADNKIQLRKGGGGQIARTNMSITDTTRFHHVVLTKGGISTLFFVDGQHVTEGVQVLGLQDTANALQIGGLTAALLRFPGNLDEIALYGSLLSGDEILEHYRVGALVQAATDVALRWDRA